MEAGPWQEVLEEVGDPLIQVSALFSFAPFLLFLLACSFACFPLGSTRVCVCVCVRVRREMVLGVRTHVRCDLSSCRVCVRVLPPGRGAHQ